MKRLSHVIWNYKPGKKKKNQAKGARIGFNIRGESGVERGDDRSHPIERVGMRSEEHT